MSYCIKLITKNAWELSEKERTGERTQLHALSLAKECIQSN